MDIRPSVWLDQLYPLWLQLLTEEHRKIARCPANDHWEQALKEPIKDSLSRQTVKRQALLTRGTKEVNDKIDEELSAGTRFFDFKNLGKGAPRLQVHCVVAGLCDDYLLVDLDHRMSSMIRQVVVGCDVLLIKVDYSQYRVYFPITLDAVTKATHTTKRIQLVKCRRDTFNNGIASHQLIAKLDHFHARIRDHHVRFQPIEPEKKNESESRERISVGGRLPILEQTMQWAIQQIAENSRRSRVEKDSSVYPVMSLPPSSKVEPTEKAKDPSMKKQT